MTYRIIDGEPPEYGGWEDSAQFRQRQAYAETSARLERQRIQAENDAKMRQLNAKLSSGELDAVDPLRRLWHGLAPGERHGDRQLARLDAQLKRYRAEDNPDNPDPRIVLAWMNEQRDECGELREREPEIRHRWGDG